MDSYVQTYLCSIEECETGLLSIGYVLRYMGHSIPHIPTQFYPYIFIFLPPKTAILRALMCHLEKYVMMLGRSTQAQNPA